MNGYLQRMTLSAMNPGGSIHPVVGSVFSAAKYDRTPDTFPGDEEISSPDHPESPTIRSPEAAQVLQATEAPPGLSVSPILPLQTPIGSPEQARQHQDPKPLSQEQSSLRRPATKFQEQEADKSESLSVRVDHEAELLVEPLEPQRQRRNHGVDIKGVYSPLVPEAVGGTASPGNFCALPNTVASATGKNQRDVSRQKPSAQEPDEIQIHIGRIEVTAVPPAPARPEAKPAARSVSLAEYLKRRDGRGK
jgi:hypothetical protein